MTNPNARVVQTIATSTHGRYLVRPPVGAAEGLLVGFHGYAQNAESFLNDIDTIPGASAWTAVSVQALNRFYTRAGDVVASWMTSEDRELAIADNIEYVLAIVNGVRDSRSAGAAGRLTPLVFLGFSQGVAMAFRSAGHVQECKGVIALAGDIPPEIRAGNGPLPPVLIARGKDDEWYTPEKLQVDVSWLNATGTSMTVCEYPGGHVWTDQFREAAGAFLARVAAENTRS